MQERFNPKGPPESLEALREVFGLRGRAAVMGDARPEPPLHETLARREPARSAGLAVARAA